MISKALTFLCDELNNYLKMSFGIDESIVKLAGLQNSTSNPSNNLLLTVVNIEEENSLTRGLHKTSGGRIDAAKPPLYLDIYILVSQSYDDNNYSEGLKMISKMASFFQSNPILNNYNNILPEGIDKLTFEIANIDIDKMSNFWGALGAGYQPSILYKMRMLRIENREVIKAPPFLESSSDINP